MFEHGLIGDLRRCVSFPSNSCAAALHAMETRSLRRVLAFALFNNAEGGRFCFFFIPDYTPEYFELRTIPFTEWYNKLEMPPKDIYPYIWRPDDLGDFLNVPALEEIWVELDPAMTNGAAAVAGLAEACLGDKRVVAVSHCPVPGKPEIRVCDPSGRHDYILCDGSLRDWVRWRRAYSKTVSLTPRGWSYWRTAPIF